MTNAIKVKKAMEQQQQLLRKTKTFFMKDNVKRQLDAMVSYLIPHRSDVALILNIGGGSYTDNKKIVVGLPEYMLGSSNEELFTALRALVGHECQHVNSSNFEAYKAYQEKVREYFQKKYPELHNRTGTKVIQHMAVSFGNGIEDGRIEVILVNNRPGYLNFLKYFRLRSWDAQPVTGENEFHEFLWSMVSIAKTGMRPKDFEKYYTNSRLDKNLKEIEQDVRKAIHIRTAEQCLDTCFELIKKSEDYLVELMREMIQQRKDMDENQFEMGNDQYSSSDEIETGDGQGEGSPVHFDPPAQPADDAGDDEKEDEDGDGQSEKPDNEKADGESEANSTSTDTDAADEEQGGDSGSDGEKTEGDEGEDSSEKGEGKGDDGQEDLDGQTDASTDGDADEEVSEEERAAAAKKEQEEREAQAEEHAAWVKDQLEKLTEEVVEDAKEKLEITPKQKEKDAPKNNKYALTPEESKGAVYDTYGRLPDFDLEEIRENVLTEPLADSILVEGKKFRREVERLFKNKESFDTKGLKRGTLDVGALYKIGMKETNVFQKTKVQTLTDYVAYLLWDGSGSMAGHKMLESGKAVAIAEEGLKGVVPFKVMQFNSSVGARMMQHRIVKDFDEDKKMNYAYNFMLRNRVQGRNCDGLAIRIATKELMKRPEKDRILFVFSDGLPSLYVNDLVAIKDVESAVKEAKKQGILVVGIQFGTLQERQQTAEMYQRMYGRNIISCEPNELTTQLSRLLRKILKR